MQRHVLWSCPRQFSFSLLARVNFQTSFLNRFYSMYLQRYINEGFTSNLCTFASFNEVFLESAVASVQVSHLI